MLLITLLLRVKVTKLSENYNQNIIRSTYL